MNLKYLYFGRGEQTEETEETAGMAARQMMIFIISLSLFLGQESRYLCSLLFGVVSV